MRSGKLDGFQHPPFPSNIFNDAKPWLEAGELQSRITAFRRFEDTPWLLLLLLVVPGPNPLSELRVAL